jgi:putative endonuclease
MDDQYITYMMASKRSGALYVGRTSDLATRVGEHKHDLVDGFTKLYKVHMLVYYQYHDNIESAIQHEQKLKQWHRKWKLDLIEESNPDWHDLYADIPVDYQVMPKQIDVTDFV